MRSDAFSSRDSHKEEKLRWSSPGPTLAQRTHKNGAHSLWAMQTTPIASLGWVTARRDQVLLSGGRAGPNSLELNLCFSTQEVGIQEQAGYA